MTEEELMNSKVSMAEKQYGPAPGIDLSKIKNTKAAKIEKEFKEKISTTKAKKNKFCFMEDYQVKLPSNGIPYKDFDDDELANGEITIRPMSLADEEILGNKTYSKNGTIFSKLLDSCIVNNVNVKKLIPYDVFYLLYYLRKITYGEDYKFETTCPECGKKYEKTIDISEVEWEEIEDKAVRGVKTIKLPVSKFTLTIEAPTLGNEEEVVKISKKFEDSSDTILNYVVRTRELLDDNGEPVNPDDYADFFEALPGKDRAEITKAFEKIEDLTVPVVKMSCPKCSTEDEASIPFTKDFFRY